jgi:cytochrome c-type biogenesis protein
LGAVIDAPLALGFAAGMVAAFNPCGFALVPAYLGFFLGDDNSEVGVSGAAPVARALAVGAAITVGFVVVFGVAGVLATTFSFAVERFAPWVSVPIGLVLIGIGVAMALGWKPALALPRLAAGGTRRGLASMGLFGASYATVSLSCTLPVFLAVVATTFGDASVVSGMATYLAYALGMGTVLTGLAVAIALAHATLTTAFRRAVPAVARLGGLLLVIAGAYVSWYAVYEIRLERNDDAAAGPVVAVTRWSGQVSNWVNEVGPGWIAVGAVMLLGVALVLGRVRERRASGSDRTDAATEREGESSPSGPGEAASGSPGRLG